MNDRFKFRAWDKQSKHFAENMSVNLMHDALPHTEMSERYELMQCTGLKDKNGKLIYEGDIIKDDYLGEINTIKHEIDYEGDSRPFSGFLINTYDVMGYIFEDKIVKTIEILGNIHQNPELLS